MIVQMKSISINSPRIALYGIPYSTKQAIFCISVKPPLEISSPTASKRPIVITPQYRPSKDYSSLNYKQYNFSQTTIPHSKHSAQNECSENILITDSFSRTIIYKPTAAKLRPLPSKLLLEHLIL